VLLLLVCKVNAQGVDAIKNSSDWHYTGSKANSYEMGSDAGVRKTMWFTKIKSIQSKINGFGTIIKYNRMRFRKNSQNDSVKK
jgi:hypothetical protein